MSNEAVFLEHLLENSAYRWKDLPVKAYTAAGTQSRGMTKQILFEGTDMLPTEIRYFESEPGGYSALEAHEHVHHVIIMRGSGHALLGDHVHPITTYDSIHIPSWTYHQFYAAADSYLGFLCMVHPQRDRPKRPDEEALKSLLSNPAVKDWIRY